MSKRRRRAGGSHRTHGEARAGGALEHFSPAWLANVSGLARKMFTGKRRPLARVPRPLSLSLSLSVSSSIHGLIPERRETRKVQERRVQNCATDPRVEPRL